MSFTLHDDLSSLHAEWKEQILWAGVFDDGQQGSMPALQLQRMHMYLRMARDSSEMGSFERKHLNSCIIKYTAAWSIGTAADRSSR